MSFNRSAKGGNECSDLWETTFSSLDDLGKIVFISYYMDDYLFLSGLSAAPLFHGRPLFGRLLEYEKIVIFDLFIFQ